MPPAVAGYYAVLAVLLLSYRADTIFVMHNVQREITPKVYKIELPFLHSARHLMLIDICIKFREYSLSGFQVIERTRFL